MMKIFLLLVLASSAFSNGVEKKHQACKVSSDCSLVVLACACIHNSTCNGSDAKAKGIVDSVNKNFVKEYESFSKCTPEETKQCSVAGPCAQQGQWLPACEKELCTAVFKPRT